MSSKSEIVSPNRIGKDSQRTAAILDSAAFHGLAGKIVRANDPFTEADPLAVLATTLVIFGNVVGHSPYFTVGYERHYLNLYAGIVGATSKGRKGQSSSTPIYIFRMVDSSWANNRITSGLSSGEGLITQVRDRLEQPIKRGNVVIDEGVSDKRLLLIESELSQGLKLMGREGNILSPTLRQAWDSGNLSPLTKHNQIKATGAHISIIGHITIEELMKHLCNTDRVNGFGNRFIWLAVTRSKTIPDPQCIPYQTLDEIVRELSEAVTFGKTVQVMRRSIPATELWEKVYPGLSEGRPGIVGTITSRAEAQVMRLACVYALLALSDEVKVGHLKAALDFWKYAERSADSIFRKTG